MGNIRVNKLALELNIQNDQVIEELNKLDIPVKNHMSTITEEAADQVRELLLEEKKSKSKKTPGTLKGKTAKTKASVKTTDKPPTKGTAKKKTAAPKVQTGKSSLEKIEKLKTGKPIKAKASTKTTAKASSKTTPKTAAKKKAV